MLKKWNAALRKKVKDDEREKKADLLQIDEETFVTFKHNMQVEGAALKEVYKDLKTLEQADLEDYKEIERKYGRTN